MVPIYVIALAYFVAYYSMFVFRGFPSASSEHTFSIMFINSSTTTTSTAIFARFMYVCRLRCS